MLRSRIGSRRICNLSAHRKTFCRQTKSRSSANQAQMKICDAYELRGRQECRARSLFSEQFQDGSGLDEDAGLQAGLFVGGKQRGMRARQDFAVLLGGFGLWW